jgi:hypothetical protein
LRQHTARHPPKTALKNESGTPTSRSAIRSVGASAPNVLNCWLHDLGSNQGPAELRVFSHLGRIPYRNFRELHRFHAPKGQIVAFFAERPCCRPKPSGASHRSLTPIRDSQGLLPLRSYGLLRTGRSIAWGLTLNMQVECAQVVRASGGTAATAGGASRFMRITCLTIRDVCAWIQSMSCRMEPHTESSWRLSMRRIMFRMTDPMTCCAPAMPMFADCSTMKPVLASFRGFMK